MIADILIDSSVIIDLILGNKTREVEILNELDKRGECYGVPAICAQEVLQGARSKKDWNKLWKYLSSYDLVFSTNPVNFHVQSAKLYYKCRRKGLSLNNAIDCMIAQLSIENNAALLSSDRDFYKIKEISNLKTL